MKNILISYDFPYNIYEYYGIHKEKSDVNDLLGRTIVNKYLDILLENKNTGDYYTKISLFYDKIENKLTGPELNKKYEMRTAVQAVNRMLKELGKNKAFLLELEYYSLDNAIYKHHITLDKVCPDNRKSLIQGLEDVPLDTLDEFITNAILDDMGYKYNIPLKAIDTLYCNSTFIKSLYEDYIGNPLYIDIQALADKINKECKNDVECDAIIDNIMLDYGKANIHGKELYLREAVTNEYPLNFVYYSTRLSIKGNSIPVHDYYACLADFNEDRIGGYKYIIRDRSYRSISIVEDLMGKDGPKMRLAEASKKYEVTQQRIRQLRDGISSLICRNFSYIYLGITSKKKETSVTITNDSQISDDMLKILYMNISELEVKGASKHLMNCITERHVGKHMITHKWELVMEDNYEPDLNYTPMKYLYLITVQDFKDFKGVGVKTIDELNELLYDNYGFKLAKNEKEVANRLFQISLAKFRASKM